MLKSKFILNVLSLLIDDGSSNSRLLGKQLFYLNEDVVEYTGTGVFIKFLHEDEILTCKLESDIVILNGLIIKSREIDDAGAEATLHIKKGIIEYLEIWSYNGVYPQKELDSYTLIQGWDGAKGLTMTY